MKFIQECDIYQLEKAMASCHPKKDPLIYPEVIYSSNLNGRLIQQSERLGHLAVYLGRLSRLEDK